MSISTNTVQTPATELVEANAVRVHVLDLIESGRVTRQGLSALTGVPLVEIESILPLGRNRTPRQRISKDSAAKLMLVHTDHASLPPATRTMAIGSKRRLQALIALGWSTSTIASWMRATPVVLEAFLAPDAYTVTARAHCVIAKLFTQKWGVVPTKRDPDSLERAAANGWATALAWDDIDLDPAPSSRSRRRKMGSAKAPLDEVDEVAVELALRGEPVILNSRERSLAVARAHERQLPDATISVLTGIPLHAVQALREELDLPQWEAHAAAA